MNNTFHKTFYTCSTGSLFLITYKKISKKAVKIVGFVQCSVHIFLGHDSSVHIFLGYSFERRAY